MTKNAVTSPAFVGMGIVIMLMAVSACSTQSAPESGSLASAEGQPTTNSAAIPKSLPDSVPLATGAELVEATKSFSSDRVTGWTAVSVTAAGSPLNTVAAQLNQTITNAGWTAKLSGTETEGYVIGATRTVGSQQQWLNVNVTTPVPGSGPAVTYRFASSSASTKTPSPGVAR